MEGRAGFDEGQHAGVGERFAVADVEVLEVGRTGSLGEVLDSGVCEVVELFEVEVREKGGCGEEVG